MKTIHYAATLLLPLLLILLLASSFSLSSYGQSTNPNTAPITTEDLVTYTKESSFIKEFQVPIEERGLKGVTADPQGNAWIYYSTNKTSTIFKFDPEKQSFSQFQVEGQTTADEPVINLAAGHLAFDNESNSVWFGDARTNSIGKLDVKTGNVQLNAIPTKNAGPMGIALAPDGKSVWFTEITGDKIAKIDTGSMKITEYSTGDQSGPALLSFDDKGILWVSLSFSHTVLRVDATTLSSSNPSSAMTELKLQGKDTFSPFGIAVSGDKVYVSDHGSSRVIVSDVGFAKYNSYWTSPAKEFPTTLPGEVVADKQGNIYFPQHGGNRISMIDKSGVVTEYDIPSGPLSTALFLAASNGKVWFTEWASNKLGYLDTNAKIPFDIQVKGNINGFTLTKDKSQSIDFSLVKSDGANSSVSLSEVGIAAIGMTESGLQGVTYTSQPPRVNLDQSQGADVKITLITAERAMPGKYTLMIRATAPEKDGLLVSKLYPVSFVLDVPTPVSQNNNPSNTAAEQASTDSLIRDTTRILAASAAVGLVGYLIYNRIKKKSDITK